MSSLPPEKVVLDWPYIIDSSPGKAGRVNLLGPTLPLLPIKSATTLILALPPAGTSTEAVLRKTKPSAVTKRLLPTRGKPAPDWL